MKYRYYTLEEVTDIVLNKLIFETLLCLMNTFDISIQGEDLYFSYEGKDFIMIFEDGNKSIRSLLYPEKYWRSYRKILRVIPIDISNTETYYTKDIKQLRDGRVFVSKWI